jgi:hypothetical protein
MCDWAIGPLRAEGFVEDDFLLLMKHRAMLRLRGDLAVRGSTPQPMCCHSMPFLSISQQQFAHPSLAHADLLRRRLRGKASFLI